MMCQTGSVSCGEVLIRIRTHVGGEAFDLVVEVDEPVLKLASRITLGNCSSRGSRCSSGEEAQGWEEEKGELHRGWEV